MSLARCAIAYTAAKGNDHAGNRMSPARTEKRGSDPPQSRRPYPRLSAASTTLMRLPHRDWSAKSGRASGCRRISRAIRMART